LSKNLYHAVSRMFFFHMNCVSDDSFAQCTLFFVIGFDVYDLNWRWHLVHWNFKQ